MSPSPQSVIVAAMVLPIAGTMAVALRICARRTKKAQLKSDDWTILVGLALTWGLGVVLIYGAAVSSFGGHTAINPTTGAERDGMKEQNAIMLEFAIFLLMVLAYGFIKLSVLLLYRRLFVGTFFNWYSLTMGAVIITWSLGFFFAKYFQCGTHVTAFWTSGATQARFCDNSRALHLGFTISDVLTDLMVLATPLPIVWKLRLSASDRLALTCLFLLGLLSTAAGIVRMTFVILDAYDTQPGFRDLIGVTTNIVVWSHVEAGVGVVAACLPTVRPLFRRDASDSLVLNLRSKLPFNSFWRSKSKNRRSGSENVPIRQSEMRNLPPSLDRQMNVITPEEVDNSLGISRETTNESGHVEERSGNNAC